MPRRVEKCVNGIMKMESERQIYWPLGNRYAHFDQYFPILSLCKGGFPIVRTWIE